MGSRRTRDLSKERFDGVRAIEPTDKRAGSRQVVWKCECLRCGKEFFARTDSLLSGATRSCGCLRAELSSSRLRQRDTLVEDTDLDLLTQGKRTDNTSGVKGVSFHRRSGKYMAYITLAGKRRYLGLFATVEEAAVARREAEIELFDPILEAHGRKTTDDKTLR